ncbi:hypothetical protein [Streptomyces niger]|uniref:hypothetical protein n=1 Tax=Streptomyces niger TaxID=66373 RepID=UPI000AC39677|nr:hypothetical protein [Streptomyces niger]
MRIRTALAAAALAAASLVGSAGLAAAAPAHDPGNFVITPVNQLADGNIPPCYQDLYATPSATICH